MVKKRGKQSKAVQEASPKPPETPPDLAATPSLEVTFLEVNGVEPFTRWFRGLRDNMARQKITTRLRTVSSGSFGDTTPIGEGVSELRIDYGPGYRIYYGQRGSTVVIIISGGDKSTQTADTQRAKELWKEYKNALTNAG